MKSKLTTRVALTLGAAFALAMPAIAADLPPTRIVKTHSAGKATPGYAIQVGDKHAILSGGTWHAVYNDAGSGPLHMGSVVCTWSSDDIKGSYNDTGVCAFSDAGGADKIFAAFSGKGTDNVDEQGTGTITGGTGKYDGIQGKVAYQCKISDPAQIIFTCNQQFDYRLKTASATR
jgi:hypothetical protein